MRIQVYGHENSGSQYRKKGYSKATMAVYTLLLCVVLPLQLLVRGPVCNYSLATYVVSISRKSHWTISRKPIA